jgi:hypothetical protein
LPKSEERGREEKSFLPFSYQSLTERASLAVHDFAVTLYTQFLGFLEVKVPGLPDKKIAFLLEGYLIPGPEL